MGDGNFGGSGLQPLPESDFVEVDVSSLELTRPRSVGVEQVGLHALAQLEFEPLLESLGINAITRAMILAQVVARMAAPGSELATWRWLNDTSALGELLDLSFTDLSLMRLYRAGDVLLKHQEAIEVALFERVRSLFGLETTVTLYDLTNTYFEGAAALNPKARRGHSKEKRTDCPLLTLGLILDGSGFVRRSRVFDGNAVEGRTLETMLTDLSAPSGALVVMDRGIATEANLAWLKEKGYRYLVMSREA
ncbi:MAG: IS1634 family transposase, partial [Pseudomonadota bacterium]|nr:IS1634 family transposase [Pseudomonadota bacterium]